MEDTALKRAIKEAGGQKALADRIGVTQQLVSYWLNGPGQVSAIHVLKVERETGISRHDLRPDLYPRPEEAAA